METTLQQPPWSTLKKTGFRFCFLYFVVYIFFTPNNELPLVNKLYEGISSLMQKVIPWFAANVLGLKNPITIFTNGSGDTTYDYVLWLFGILLAVLGTVIWTVAGRRQQHHRRLVYWLVVILRFYLFYTMMLYGLYKVIKLQFPEPGVLRLSQPYGESSPMGLAWTFMGQSATYNYFTGIGELLGGILLVFRRTTILGALLCLAIMLNVFMMNMGYDIPVKLLSFNTILMCLCILAADGRRLLRFFVLNKTTHAAPLPMPLRAGWPRITGLALKWGFVLFVIWTNLAEAIKANKQHGDKAPRPPLYGLYNTEYFVRNADTLPPLQTDTSRWKQLIVNWPGVLHLRQMNDSLKRYGLTVDTTAHTLAITHFTDTARTGKLQYSQPGNGVLLLTGRLWGDSVSIGLRRYDENKYLLRNRGFHWINERPMNR